MQFHSRTGCFLCFLCFLCDITQPYRLIKICGICAICVRLETISQCDKKICGKKLHRKREQYHHDATPPLNL